MIDSATAGPGSQKGARFFSHCGDRAGRWSCRAGAAVDPAAWLATCRRSHRFVHKPRKAAFEAACDRSNVASTSLSGSSVAGCAPGRDNLPLPLDDAAALRHDVVMARWSADIPAPGGRL